MAFQLYHAERLKGLHPDLVKVVQLAVSRSPFNITCLEGMRTLERQKQLLAAKATTTLKSRHLDGHAVDLAPYLDIDKDGDLDVSWSWPLYHQFAPVMKAAASDLGVMIEWGGDWKTFKDGPHWQLPWKQYP